ncbi:DEAD/DEAH box helicase family protein, partial [Escherichia coli]
LYREVSSRFFRVTLNDPDIKLKNTFKNINNLNEEGIYISTFQKLSMLSPEDLDETQSFFDLIIIDEGHSEPSPVWREIVRQSDAIKVVITATPYRNDLFELNVDLDDYFIFTFKQAISDKIITEPNFIQVNSMEKMLQEVQLFLEKNENIKCIIKCKYAYDISRYHESISKKFKTVSIHETFRNDEASGKFKSVNSALKSDNIRVLIHQHKLDEGVDLPEAKLLVLTYQVGSGRELVQTIGRVVRNYNSIEPMIIDLASSSNERMWQSYRVFDDYISTPSGSKGFIKSLSTTNLIKGFLDNFPEYSYFSSRFRERLDLQSINANDISIPLASVCFIEKGPNYSTPLLLDKIYWELHTQGSLVKEIKNDHNVFMYLYISFNSSRYLSDKLFFEPKLEIIIIKELSNSIAIFDSAGAKYANRIDLNLANPININRLTALAAATKVREIKEAHSRAIGTAKNRPEAMSLKGKNLENINSTQRNAMYALTTLKVVNKDEQGKNDSSFYIGARSGRVSDQMERNFSIEELSEWIEKIDLGTAKEATNNGRLIKSFSQPINEKPNSDIVSIILDLSDFDTELISEKNFLPDYYYLQYSESEGAELFVGSKPFKIQIQYEEDKHSYLLTTTNNYDDFNKIISYLNNDYFRILFLDGTTYSASKFYKFSLPFEKGITAEESWAGRSLISIPALLSKGLKEKGKYDKKDMYINTTSTSFDKNSIFYLIDQLKNHSNSNATLPQLGPFHPYIPNCDLVLCTDMDTEPCDFIVSSPDKLCFIHVKCGKSFSSPKSSAGAIAEVGSQAIKNLTYLISHSDANTPGNYSIWDKAWPSHKAKHKLESRFRLAFNEIGKIPNKENKLKEKTWELISNRRKSPLCNKEIWIVMGNSFSKKHFIEEMSKDTDQQSETIQAFQLIEDWLSSADEMGVDIKIFTS